MQKLDLIRPKLEKPCQVCSRKNLLPPLINDKGTCFLANRTLTWLHHSGIWWDVQIALESGLLSPKRLTHYRCFVSENGCFEKHPPTQDDHKTRVSSQCGPFAVILRHQPTFCLAFRAVKFGRLFLRLFYFNF